MQSRTSLSDFVRRRAVDAAVIEFAERRTIAIPAKDWEAFEAWAARPAKKIPALAELAVRKPTWRK